MGIDLKLCRWRAWAGLLLAAAMMLSACGTVTPAADALAEQRARLRMELALGYFQNGQTDVAQEEVQQALAANPALAAAHNLQGLILVQQGDKAGAERSFRRALALDGHDADARHNLGLLLCNEGRMDEAANEFARALAEPAYRSKDRTRLAASTCARQVPPEPTR